MFCPQCGNESSDQQRYCRTCGANLTVIGKAVTLSDAMSKIDGVPAKLKELVNNVKIAHVTDEVSRAMDKMNQEIARSASDHRHKARWRREKSAEERRERHLAKGVVKLFWGGGLTVFLYFLANALVLKLPPDFVARVPFEIDPVVHVLWLIGLIPMLSGAGHILAGLTIKPGAATKQIEFPADAPLRIDPPIPEPLRHDPEQTMVRPHQTPPSVTDRTTNILERDPMRQTSGSL
jgi:hypothetical protein